VIQTLDLETSTGTITKPNLIELLISSSYSNIPLNQALMPTILTRLPLALRGFLYEVYPHHSTRLYGLNSRHQQNISLSCLVSRFFMSHKAPLSVAIVGVGLVGSELISQLLCLPSPSPFKVVSLTSSKRTVYSKDGLSVTPETWTSTLSSSSDKPDLLALAQQLSTLDRAVLVDNTAAQYVAELYPEFLKRGVHVVTPNKKAFSGSQQLYDKILKTSRESGARWLNESTVGAGLPVVQTLKDLVATGDKVRSPRFHCSVVSDAKFSVI
jgi:hypothetical protein